MHAKLWQFSAPAFEDILGCQVAAFEWAESYDTKDWDRLLLCVAPSLHLDYRSVMGMKWDDMPATLFVELASSQKFLGNIRIRTQHMIGVSKWEQTGRDKIIGHHQMRVAHQKYKEDDLQEVEIQGHAYGRATIHYQRVHGVWKFAGLVPDIRWYEADYNLIFAQ